jgi:hypothetical protein
LPSFAADIAVGNASSCYVTFNLIIEIDKTVAIFDAAPVPDCRGPSLSRLPWGRMRQYATVRERNVFTPPPRPSLVMLATRWPGVNFANAKLTPSGRKELVTKDNVYVCAPISPLFRLMPLFRVLPVFSLLPNATKQPHILIRFI